MAETWYRVRGYPHFDRRVSLKFAKSYVTDAARVARHSFFPFIGYTKTIPRYRPDEGKVQDKDRQILYAAHLDGHIYAYYAKLLNERLEGILRAELFGPSILAYRALGKSNIDFAKDAFNDVELLSPCVVMCFDITGFFDNMRHDILKDAWTDLLGGDSLPPDHYAVFRSVTRYAWAERNKVYTEFEIDGDRLKRGISRICSPTEFRDRVRGARLINVNSDEAGIPQGSPISAVLSNVYLTGFDRQMYQLADEIGGRYRRYSDDIMLICPANKRTFVESRVYEAIKDHGLECNSEKTDTSVFSRSRTGDLDGSPPLQYLGFTFDGQRRLIRSKTLANYYRRMCQAVRRAKRAAQENPEHPQVFRRKLYRRFTHLGRQNFISYAYRAAETLDEEAVRRQVARHWDKLHREIDRE